MHCACVAVERACREQGSLDGVHPLLGGGAVGRVGGGRGAGLEASEDDEEEYSVASEVRRVVLGHLLINRVRVRGWGGLGLGLLRVQVRVRARTSDALPPTIVTIITASAHRLGTCATHGAWAEQARRGRCIWLTPPLHMADTTLTYG